MQQQRERVLDLIDAPSFTTSRSPLPRERHARRLEHRGPARALRERFGVEPTRHRGHRAARRPRARALRPGREVFAGWSRRWSPSGPCAPSGIALLEEIDRAWIDHLTNMDHLRDGIGLRGYGQRDPKLEFKKEGFDMFTGHDGSVNHSCCRSSFRRTSSSPKKTCSSWRPPRCGASSSGRSPWSPSTPTTSPVSATRPWSRRSTLPPSTPPPSPRCGSRPPPHAARGSAPPPAAAPEAVDAAPLDEGAAIAAESLQPVRRSGPKIGRNDACPCGSGKKYKVCHGQPGAEADDATKTEIA
jgi:preprotein translocase subunit SecA